jgi:hypothetical protein
MMGCDSEGGDSEEGVLRLGVWGVSVGCDSDEGGDRTSERTVT